MNVSHSWDVQLGVGKKAHLYLDEIPTSPQTVLIHGEKWGLLGFINVSNGVEFWVPASKIHKLVVLKESESE